MHILFSIFLVLVAHSFTLNAAQAAQNQPRKHTAEQQALVFSPSMVPANKRARFYDSDDEVEVESHNPSLAGMPSPQTPNLTAAVQAGNREEVEKLITAGADITELSEGASLLYEALVHITNPKDRNQMILFLRAKGVKPCKLFEYIKTSIGESLELPQAAAEASKKS